MFVQQTLSRGSQTVSLCVHIHIHSAFSWFSGVSQNNSDVCYCSSEIVFVYALWQNLNKKALPEKL